jgi:predicted dehydrogenase
MKQVIRKGLKEIIVDEVPDPIASPHHVVVAPEYSLISSGTETASIHRDGVLKEVADNPSHIRKILDVMKLQGPVRTLAEVRAKFSEYAVLGYSGAGRIFEKHPTVTDLEIGDRVAYGGEGTGHGELILTGRNLVARIPEGLKGDRASFATLGSIAMNAVRNSSVGIGDTVAVIGLGLVGQLVSQLARAQGAVVIAIDLKPDRVQLAQTLGAERAILGGAEAVATVSALTNGRGADCVFIAAAAKSSAPCQQALALCRDRGRIVVVGAVEMAFPWNDMYLKEIQLFMSRAYGPGSYDPNYEKNGIDYPYSYVRWTENRNMEEFLRLVATERVKVDPLITHRFALEQAPKAYDTILDPAANSLAVLLEYPKIEDASGNGTSSRRRVDVRPLCAQASGIGVAVVGAGNLARWAHLPNIKKAPGVQLRAVYSTSGARGKSYALRFGANYCSTDYEQILRDNDINAVVIVSRNQHHARQTIAALEAGKHVFVEKPMAITEQECIALADAQRSSGKLLTVGFNRRFAPYYVELKKSLAGRKAPAVLNCRVNSPGVSGAYWMADPSIGGAILGEACHFVDLMYWLLESEPISVSAYSLPTGRTEPIGENNIVASFLFADGSIGNLTYCTVGGKTSGGERVEAFAPGIGAATENFNKLWVHRAMTSSKYAYWAEKGYKAQMDDFFRAIREGHDAKVTLRDGVRATIGCLQLLESARAREPRPIEIDSILAD